MSSYVPTIGLEIHAELKTATKMFCASKNDADESRPNANICAVCMAHPGTLPVINKEAVRHVLRVGTALGGTIADYTEFDRKNYFYPDLPKGYQLSQYQYPLISGGSLKGVQLTRIHLEEDTASSSHDDATGETQVNYNRAGVPLMELVTEPVIHSAKQAGDFGRELQLLLRYLGVSDADMEKGNMRLEANISVSRDENLGTKVEVKNINSFRAMERAIDYEVARHIKTLESGGTITQETRGWDDAKQQTYPQRIKEGSADYRYFPEPDLPSLRLSEVAAFDREILRTSLPELPEERRARYTSVGIKTADCEQFTSYPALGNFMDTVAEQRPGDTKFTQLVSNYIANDLVSLIRDTDIRDTEFQAEISIPAEKFGKIMVWVHEGTISSRAAKDLLLELITHGSDPEVLAAERGLLVKQDAAELEAMVEGVLAQHVAVVADYKAGKEAALQFLIGMCMKALKGAGNPGELKDLLIRKLSA